LFLGGSSLPAGEGVPPRLTNAQELEGAFQSKELEGKDPKVAELAAHRLLEAIARKDRSEESKAALLNYLLEKLSPTTALKGDGSLVTAGRIVDAMATWITSSGPPFNNVSDVILPLVGTGNLEFRETVIRALRALVRREMESSRGSPTVQVLTGRFMEFPPPSETFLQDASRVLWETDGKALLETLVGIVSLNGGPVSVSPLTTLSLAELRSRTSLDFASGEGWQKWWSESHELALDRILLDCQRRAREEYVSNWRQIIRRLRETEDAERLLLAIQDTLEGVYGLELRLAAVSALGDYADWVLDRPEPEKSPPERLEKDPKDRFLARGVQLLLTLFNRKDSYMERAEVLRAALGALRKYHAFLERHAGLHAEVSSIVAARLHALSFKSGESRREEMLEVLRLAGALRVVDASRFVETLLEEIRPPGGDDLELITAAVTTLGRLKEKKGLGGETAKLLMAHFKKPREGSEKAVRELRRSCVAALSAGSDEDDVRSELRGFFREILFGNGEKDLRIPAILGLGTLARQHTPDALESLVEVLSKGGEFEPQEVIAAVDSIAYVGGEQALYSFLRYAPLASDKAVLDHVSKKVSSMVDAGGGKILVWALEKLERLALDEDSLGYLELSGSLGSQLQIKELLAAGKDLGNEESLECVWKANLLLARAADLLDRDGEMTAVLSSLTELIQKNPLVKEKLAQGVSDLADFKVTLCQRALIKGKLSQPDSVDPAALLKDFEALLTLDSTWTSRWRNLHWVYTQLSQGAPTKPLDRARELWHTLLASEPNAAYWKDLPRRFRERHLSALDALKEKLHSSPPAPSRPPQGQ
jgi:hypothetical protein